MTVLILALRSLRHRTSGFVATFVSMFLGAAVLMAFSAMIDTSRGQGVDAATKDTLSIMATVVGGWGLVIVAFAVTSTCSLSVRQRAAEMALLKSVGATPAQIGRMITGEAVGVAIVAALAAIAPAILGGRLLLEALKSTGQAAPGVTYTFGPIAVSLGLGITLVAAIVAAAVTARRTTNLHAKDALVAASIEEPRMTRRRIIAAWAFLAAGLGTGIVTATVFHGKGIDAMQTGGQAGIWFAVGLALFAPVLVRKVAAILSGPLRRLGGVGGYLTGQNLRQRCHQMAGALMPIIVFTGIATGTLYMQSIENAAAPAAGQSITAEEAKDIETLNFVVVGMISVFAAIMVINTLVAITTGRKREFGQQRLAGATPPQVLGMVGIEGLVLAAAGVLFGSVASIATVIPYSIARTGSVLPSVTIAIYLGVVATAASLTLVSGLGAARRTIRVPAIDAVAT